MATDQKLTNENPIEQNEKFSLTIKTKSVEQTLLPLVQQISTLVNAKDRPIRTEGALHALVRVGHAVNVAVDRFVKVGEAIALENPFIQQSMMVACREAKEAGCHIESLTHVTIDKPGVIRSTSEKGVMVGAARNLLSSITRVLVLADWVVIMQLLAIKDKLLKILKQIEVCERFSEFVKLFSQLGSEMVQLAHASGNRQNDLKSDKARTHMSIGRSVLEKLTMLLLTTSKANLRHAEETLSRQQRDVVIMQMTTALDLIQWVATEAGLDDEEVDNGAVEGGEGGDVKINGANGDDKGKDGSGKYATSNEKNGFVGNQKQLTYPQQLQQQMILKQHEIYNGSSDEQQQLLSNCYITPAFRAIKLLEDHVDQTKVTLVNKSIEKVLDGLCEQITEASQDFTDSAYTSHEYREMLVNNCQHIRHNLNMLLRIGYSLEQSRSASLLQSSSSLSSPMGTRDARALETVIMKMREACRVFKKQLVDTAVEHASNVFRLDEDKSVLKNMKMASLEGKMENLQQLYGAFDCHAEQLKEVCRLLRHISLTEVLVIRCEHIDNNIKLQTPQVILASRLLSYHPSSKIALENFDVVSAWWSSQVDELSALVREVCGACRGRFVGNKSKKQQHYWSLPRPGKHGANTRSLREQEDLKEQRTSDNGITSPDKLSTKSPLASTLPLNNKTSINNTLPTNSTSDTCSINNPTSYFNSDVNNMNNNNSFTAFSNANKAKNNNINIHDQARIIKTGLEMKLLTTEVDAEAERWLEPDNEIVRRAKNMSCMAFSIYLFTRGEGPLKNTNDLFVQADYFAEEGAKLYRTVREFAKQVPQSVAKSNLFSTMDKVPASYQHLTFTVRSNTVGKAATFNKVDQVIQDTKELMNLIAKLVTSCYVCATKFNINYKGELVGPWSSVSPPSSKQVHTEFSRGSALQRGMGQGGSMNREEVNGLKREDFVNPYLTLGGLSLSDMPPQLQERQNSFGKPPLPQYLASDLTSKVNNCHNNSFKSTSSNKSMLNSFSDINRNNNNSINNSFKSEFNPFNKEYSHYRRPGSATYEK